MTSTCSASTREAISRPRSEHIIANYLMCGVDIHVSDQEYSSSRSGASLMRGMTRDYAVQAASMATLASLQLRTYIHTYICMYT